MIETVDSIYNRSAVGYFNNLRVPAAVLTSIISKEMFALQNTPPAAMRSWDTANGVDKSKRWRIVRYSYLLLIVLAFSLETNTIFIATQVLTQLATAQRIDSADEVAQSTEGFFQRKVHHKSLVDFLISEFEFEYVTVRSHFVNGLLCFTLAQCLRVRYALRKYRYLSLSASCCILTLVCGILSYSNANTITYGGYFNLMVRQLTLSASFLKNRIRSGPMSAFTTLFAVFTVVFAILGSIRPEFSYYGEEEGEITSS